MMSISDYNKMSVTCIRRLCLIFLVLISLNMFIAFCIMLTSDVKPKPFLIYIDQTENKMEDTTTRGGLVYNATSKEFPGMPSDLLF